jgi:hypothetical protein
MSMRFLPSLALLILPAHPVLAQEAALHLFNDRDVVLHPQPLNDRDPSDLRLLLDSELANTYASIDADRSLLLSDCGKGSPWCGNPGFSFGSIFSVAARAAGYSPHDAADAWYASASGDTPKSFAGQVAPWKGWPLNKAPFQLLAIVNRMDLAVWQGDSAGKAPAQWSGAEVRFVYGLIPPKGSDDPPPFTLILEFRLPPRGWAQFQALARSWREVSRASRLQPPATWGGGNKILAALKVALKESCYQDSPLVRLRVNRSVDGPVWGFFQWEFDARTGQFAAKPLNDQICQGYIKAPPDSALYKRYVQLWMLDASAPPPTSIPIAADLLESSGVKYTTGGMGLATPKGLCDSSLHARNILALQQCTFCHSAESQTPFTHIGNRSRSDSSPLSSFLVGDTSRKAGSQLPNLRDLYYALPDAAFPVYVNYLKSVKGQSGLCDSQESSHTTRYFSDLARRALFLSAVIENDKPTQSAIDQIHAFATDFSH